MSFKVNTKSFRLKFEDGELEGLEVRAKSCSTGDFFEIAKIADSFDPKDRDFEEVRKLFGMFANCLISWNIEGDDGPIRPDVDGLLSLDLDLVLSILTAWMDAVAGVTGPKEKNSNGGNDPKAVLNLPQESL